MAGHGYFLPSLGKFVLYCILFTQGLGDKVAEKIYKDITGVHQCFTLTNATHQIGCTSPRKGEVGVLHFISSDDDVDWLIEKGPHAPYMPIFPGHLFTDNRIEKLTKSGKINGALVLQDTVHSTVPSEFSPAESCPKDNFGAYSEDKDYGGCKKFSWNPKGSSLLFRNFGFPMFLVYAQSDANDMVECFEKHNKPVNGTAPEYPLCSAQLNDFNMAAKDTPTCIRKTEISQLGPVASVFCDPLSSYNVWSTLFPVTKDSSPLEIIMVAAQLDTSDIFQSGLGADNDATGVVALLSIAHAFGQWKREGKLQVSNMTKRIMFVFFNGEAWDYIGSSRMVYDMENDDFLYNISNKYTKGSEFPIKLEHIAMYLELAQVGLRDGGSLWMHSDPVSVQKSSKVKTKVQDILSSLSSSGTKHGATMGNASPSFDNPLPPSSFQRFLRVTKNIPGVVITDHKTAYTNKYYNSRFDDAFNIKANGTADNMGEQAQQLAKASTAIANALLKLATDSTEEIEVSSNTTSKLLYCILRAANCDLVKASLPEKSHKYLGPLPYQRYISIEKQPYTDLTFVLLRYLLGDWENTSMKNCTDAPDKHYNYDWGRGLNKSLPGICIKSTAQLSLAQSPAFKLKQYDSTEYSTWAESRWDDTIGVRIFLVSHPQKQIVALVSGIVITLVSFILVFLIERRTQVLFAAPLSSEPNSFANE